jgi:hypothetical protein
MFVNSVVSVPGILLIVGVMVGLGTFGIQGKTSAVELCHEEIMQARPKIARQMANIDLCSFPIFSLLN